MSIAEIDPITLKTKERWVSWWHDRNKLSKQLGMPLFDPHAPISDVVACAMMSKKEAPAEYASEDDE